MQRGIRILPEFGSSPAVTEMNLRIENKDFDLDEDGALTAINRFYDNIAESLKISNMPEMIPHQHIVKQESRIVATDQSIARIPIFSKDISLRRFRIDHSTLRGAFSRSLPTFEMIEMVTLPHVFVRQIINLRLGITAIHLPLPVRDLRHDWSLFIVNFKITLNYEFCHCRIYIRQVLGLMSRV